VEILVVNNENVKFPNYHLGFFYVYFLTTEGMFSTVNNLDILKYKYLKRWTAKKSCLHLQGKLMKTNVSQSMPQLILKLYKYSLNQRYHS